MRPLAAHAASLAAFEQAKREKKFILLDLEAVWCHWCHVMDETTYKTPEVIALIQSKYIPVRVDQDSRPDEIGEPQWARPLRRMRSVVNSPVRCCRARTSPWSLNARK